MINEDAVKELVRIIEWAIDDLSFTAPEDLERTWGDIGAIREALVNYKKTTIAPRYYI